MGNFDKDSIDRTSMKSTYLLTVVICLAFAATSALRAQPSWWSNGTPPMVQASGAEDAAAATQGQLKHVTVRAYEELNANLSGGAGVEIERLIYGQFPGGGWYELDGTPKPDPSAFQLVTLGQLKYIASLFFQRLVEQGYNEPLEDGNTPQDWLESWGAELYPHIDPLNSRAANIGQVKYLFSWDLSTLGPSPKLNTGVVNHVGSSNWVTVNLPNHYANMVVVASVSYDKGVEQLPAVARVRNAVGSSFELRVQNPSGNSLSEIYHINYIVAEAGYYGTDKIKAGKTTITQLSGKSSWSSGLVDITPIGGEAFTAPVVVGQVMTQENATWASFWARSSGRNTPPSASEIKIGAHVGSQSDKSLANPETLGYIIFEEGIGLLPGGVSYEAKQGSDDIRAVANTPPETYDLLAGFSLNQVGVVSSAGIGNTSGNWPILYGYSPIQDTKLLLAVDNDLINNTTRDSGRERVAYIVIDQKTVEDPNAVDSDLDGLSNLEEALIGSDPNNPDSNGDGLLDGLSEELGINTTDTDVDNDGLTNEQEIALGTNPFAEDSDRDGVNDNVDDYPLDPTRTTAPPPNPGDTTPPSITLEEPIDAVLL